MPFFKILSDAMNMNMRLTFLFLFNTPGLNWALPNKVAVKHR